MGKNKVGSFSGHGVIITRKGDSCDVLHCVVRTVRRVSRSPI